MLKSFNLYQNERKDGQTDAVELKVATQIRHNFLNNDVLMILRVKFHLDLTSTLSKKNFYLDGLDEQTDTQMDKRRVATIC